MKGLLSKGVIIYKGANEGLITQRFNMYRGVIREGRRFFKNFKILKSQTTSTDISKPRVFGV